MDYDLNLVGGATAMVRTLKSEPRELVAMSRLFSSSVVHEMARRGQSPLFARLAQESGLPQLASDSATVSEMFDAAFRQLRAHFYRDEYIYKSALTHNVLLGRHSLNTASMLTEFRVGASKADFVILNGTATAYEIKSERDSLMRLTGQVSAYRKVFAKVFVIAAESHIRSVYSAVPDDVGVLLLSNRYQISTLREALDCPERTEPTAIFDSIGVLEAKRILLSHGISVPNVPNTQLYSTLRAQFAELTPIAAHSGMVTVLRRTRTQQPLDGLVKELPRSLYAAVLSVSLRKGDHARLLSAVTTSSSKALGWA